jgi:hypothetical protein
MVLGVSWQKTADFDSSSSAFVKTTDIVSHDLVIDEQIWNFQP